MILQTNLFQIKAKGRNKLLKYRRKNDLPYYKSNKKSRYDDYTTDSLN